MTRAKSATVTAVLGLAFWATLSEATADPKKCLTMDTVFSGLKEMQYAVRGKVATAADEINEYLKSTSGSNKKKKKYPFDHIVYTNIGNPHSVGQQPLTWPRQVMALVDLPDEVGIDHPLASQMFPADVITRARKMKEQMSGFGSGAYSHSKGVKGFRQDVADFITERDGGIPSNSEDIYLTNGASQGIFMILNALIANDKCGVMIPIPQYPLYSALIDLLTGQKVGYYLVEEDGWALDKQELERAYEDAVGRGVDVRALVVINPGNPSGAVLTRQNLHDVVKFCAEKGIVLLADEVYQENIYAENAEFISCKRAAHEMNLLNKIELVSFHSTSKGVFGECGRRGGYMELVGIDEDVKDEFYKLASAFLCSALNGQIMTSLMVKGPNKGEASYEIHEQEKRGIFESLKRRGTLVSEGLNSIPGFSCQPATGSMYCFPSVEMPPGIMAKALKEKESPDTLYAVSLLEKTGICVVPASGFGQREGRFGFRTTFLPREEEMSTAVKQIQQHYEDLCKEYR